MEFPSESIQTRKETLKVKLSLNFAYLMESRRHELHRITLKKMQNARGSKEQCMICLELSHNQRSTNGQNTYQSCCMFTKKVSKSFESFGPLTLMIFNMILSIQLYTRRQKPYLLNCLISMILCYHPFLIMSTKLSMSHETTLYHFSQWNLWIVQVKLRRCIEVT